MIVINTTTLKNGIRELENVEKYYTRKSSTFSRGSFGVSASPNLANYLGKIQTIYQSIASNIQVISSFLRDYTNDVEGVENLSSGRGGYIDVSSVNAKVSSYKNSLKKAKMVDNTLPFKVNTLSFSGSTAGKNNFGQNGGNLNTEMSAGNASSQGLFSTFTNDSGGYVATGASILGGLNIGGLSFVTAPALGLLYSQNNSVKKSGPFTTIGLFENGVLNSNLYKGFSVSHGTKASSITATVDKSIGSNGVASSTEKVDMLYEAVTTGGNESLDATKKTVTGEAVSVTKQEKIVANKTETIKEGVSKPVEVIKESQVSSKPVESVGETIVPPITSSLDTVDNLDSIEVLDVPTETLTPPVTPIITETNTQEVVTPDVEPVLPPDGPIADTGEVDVVTPVTTPEVSVDTFSETLDYRMTYYYPGDNCASGTITASGLSTKDFTLNDRGWYTYDGKLVVATANKALTKGKWAKKYGSSTQRMYNLYDELTLEIDGVDYPAIVLDMCGAAMKAAKVDLFVKDRKSGLDTQIKVKIK